MTPTLADFEGRWTIARRIDDRRIGRTGSLIGTASFQPEGAGLRYEETGTLQFPGEPPLDARQSYLWHETGQGVAISFADGRPFHHFDFKNPGAAHWCDPDQYDVTYDFTTWPAWTATWQVIGPHKNYTMTTRYHRPDCQ